MRLVKQALVEWKAKRGKSCDTVMLTVVSPLEVHGAAKSLFDLTYTQERDLSPILQSVKTLVALLNPAGKPVHEYQLGEP